MKLQNPALPQALGTGDSPTFAAVTANISACTGIDLSNVGPNNGRDASGLVNLLTAGLADSDAGDVYTLIRANANWAPGSLANGFQSPNGNVYFDNNGFYGIGAVIAGAKTATGAATTTFTVTIGVTMSDTTYKVTTEGNNALSSAIHYVNNKTTTTFDVVYLAGLTGAVAFDWIVTP